MRFVRGLRIASTPEVENGVSSEDMGTKEDMYVELDAIAPDYDARRQKRMFRKLDPSGLFIGELTEERIRRMTGNYEMVAVSGEDQIANAPQLPETRCTSERREKTRGACEAIPRLFQHVTDLRTCQDKPFVMPISACVEVCI